MNAALWETQSNAILIKNLWGFHCPSKYRYGSPAGGFYYKWHYLMPLVTSDSFMRIGNAGLHPHAAKYRPAWRAEDRLAEAWQSRSSHLATAECDCVGMPACSCQRHPFFPTECRYLKPGSRSPERDGSGLRACTVLLDDPSLSPSNRSHQVAYDCLDPQLLRDPTLLATVGIRTHVHMPTHN